MGARNYLQMEKMLYQTKPELINTDEETIQFYF